MSRKFLFFIVTLFTFSLSSSAWCRILELYDEERENHKLARIYTITDEFFEKDKISILSLIRYDFFDKERTSTENESTIHELLCTIVQGKRSHLVREYGMQVRELQNDLMLVRDQLLASDVFPDLTSTEVSNLKKQIGALLHISSYLRLYDIGLGE